MKYGPIRHWYNAVGRGDSIDREGKRIAKKNDGEWEAKIQKWRTEEEIRHSAHNYEDRSRKYEKGIHRTCTVVTWH